MPTAYEVFDYHGTCSKCGRDYVTHWNPGVVYCTHCTSCGIEGSYELTCGKGEQTVESAIIKY